MTTTTQYAPIGPIRHYPDKWLSGPDPLHHQQYYAWLKHRSQAWYRGEEHFLTWQDWLEFWPPEVWHQRGRKGPDLCLTRIDPELAWEKSNCEIITRAEQFRRQGIAKRGTIRGPNKIKRV